MIWYCNRCLCVDVKEFMPATYRGNHFKVLHLQCKRCKLVFDIVEDEKGPRELNEDWERWREDQVQEAKEIFRRQNQVNKAHVV